MSPGSCIINSPPLQTEKNVEESQVRRCKRRAAFPVTSVWERSLNQKSWPIASGEFATAAITLMLALRASCSSTITAAARRPLLSTAAGRLPRREYLSTNASDAPPPEQNAPNLDDFISFTPPPPPPVRDGPPIANERRGYAKNPIATINKSPTAFSMTSTQDAPRYRLHCKSSRNNTIVMFTDEKGKCLAWFSGGSCKFKGANRATYEAGYQCAVRAFEVIKKTAATTPLGLELYFKGFGQGRDAMKTAMLAAEGTEIRGLVRSIQDRTPIKIGGCRAPKARRL